MTAIPGHNVVLQQSGTVQELAHAHTSKPSPEQAAIQQAVNERQKSTTVQEFDGPEKLKEQKKKNEFRKRQQLKQDKKKKRQAQMDPDTDKTGRLLDTTV